MCKSPSSRHTKHKNIERERELARAVLRCISDAIFLAGADGRFVYVNSAACRSLGYTRDELLTMCVSDINPDIPKEVWPAQWERCKSGTNPTFQSRQRAREGKIFPVEITSDYFEFEDTEYVCAFIRDISERKEAEVVVQDLIARLDRVQDEEQRRIARELHDTVAQDLVALKVELGHVRRSIGTRSPETRKAITRTIDMAAGCADHIATISHVLHPPLLDELGLKPALTWWVEMFGSRTGIEVDVDMPTGLERIPPDVALTILRVVQEGLNNVHRHSKSRTARVHIEFNREGVRAEIVDRGRGMRSPSAARAYRTKPRKGLGIIGMEERVKRHGGELSVTSAPGRGTTVKAKIPFPKSQA